MIETSIYTQSVKRLPANYDVEYYLTILFSYPESEWFAPSDGDKSRDYNGHTVCAELSQLGIICRQSIPVWANGSQRATVIKFLYKKDMNYTNI